MILYLILRVTAFDFASGLIPGNIEHCAYLPSSSFLAGLLRRAGAGAQATAGRLYYPLGAGGRLFKAGAVYTSASSQCDL